MCQESKNIKYKADVCIISTCVSAVICAIEERKKGNSVVIVGKKSYMASDYFNTNMFGIKNENAQGYLDIFSHNHNTPKNIKKNIEDILISNDIKILYMSNIIGICKEKSSKIVEIASKAGIYHINAKKVYDFSERYLNTFSCNNTNMRCILRADVVDIKENLNISPSKNIETDLYMLDITSDIIVRKANCKGFDILIDFNVLLKKNIDKDYLYYDLQQKRLMLKVFIWLKKNVCELHDMQFSRNLDISFFKSKYDIKDEIHEGMVNSEKYLVSKDIKKTIVNQKVEIAVIGGGSSGTYAAIEAAKKGCNTLLLEMNNQIGGTETAGGVNNYWFGKREGINNIIANEMKKIYKQTRQHRNNGLWSENDINHPFFKELVMYKMLNDSNVKLLLDSVVYGAEVDKEENKLKKIKAVKNDLLYNIEFEYAVDATGDGDIAYFSGADTVYGNENDSITYWASLAQYPTAKDYRNNFSSIVDVGDIEDYSRFIINSRKNKENDFDNGIYVAPRETRHVKGIYTVTLKDIILRKEYQDTLYKCFSNYDPKGRVTADIVYASLLPANVEISVPLRALIPTNKDGEIIKGLIIAGKAISCTHNAFPYLRMQPDLHIQGEKIGKILGKAVNSNNPIDSIYDNLSNYYNDDVYFSKENIYQAIDNISGNETMHWLDMPVNQKIDKMSSIEILLLSKRKDIEEKIISEINNEHDYRRRLILSKVAMYHGIEEGSQYIIKEINKNFENKNSLPKREGSINYGQLLPDHGLMPETVYLLNLLAWSKKDNTEVFDKVFKLLTSNKRDYFDIRKGIYHYIECFAYVSERNGNDNFAEYILSILKFNEFTSVVNKRKESFNILDERLLILTLILYRALARLAKKEGYIGLTKLIESKISLVSKSALHTLKLLTNKNFGYDILKWQEYIEKNYSDFKKNLITKKVY